MFESMVLSHRQVAFYHRAGCLVLVVPVRLPAALHQGSLYENQRTLGERFFAAPEISASQAIGSAAGEAEQ